MGNSMKSNSVIGGILKGTVIGLIILLLGLMVLAKALEREWLPEETMDYGVMILLILSAYAGASAAKRKATGSKFLICIVTGGIEFLSLLVMNLMLFHDRIHGIGATALLIFCGSGLAALKGNRGNRKKSTDRAKKYTGNLYKKYSAGK